MMGLWQCWYRNWDSKRATYWRFQMDIQGLIRFKLFRLFTISFRFWTFNNAFLIIVGFFRHYGIFLFGIYFDFHVWALVTSSEFFSTFDHFFATEDELLLRQIVKSYASLTNLPYATQNDFWKHRYVPLSLKKHYLNSTFGWNKITFTIP